MTPALLALLALAGLPPVTTTATTTTATTTTATTTATTATSTGDASAIQLWRAAPTGPRVLLAPTSAPQAALRVTFLAGAADDGIEEGLTRLAQYALIHGQDARPYADLDAALFAAGASLDVDTSVRECSFTLTAASAPFPALADRLLKLLLAPAVSDGGAARARDLASTDVLEVGSAKWLQALVAADVMITEGVEGGGDYNNPVYGDPGTIRGIPAASVQRHVRQKLAPANAIVVVAGGFDPARLKKLIAPYRGGVERPLRRPELIKYLPLNRDKRAPQQVHMQLQVVDVTDAASAAVVHVLAAYLHERLFFKLRKSGHVYSPYVGTAFEEWLDFIVVMFTVTSGKHVDYRALMMEEINAAASSPLDPGSFARAKAMARQRLADVADDPAAYSDALVARVRGAPTIGPDVLAAVDDVSITDAGAAAARFFGKTRAVSFVFGATRRERDDDKASAEGARP